MQNFGRTFVAFVLILIGTGCVNASTSLRGLKTTPGAPVVDLPPATPGISGPRSEVNLAPLSGPMRGFGTHFLPNSKVADNMTFGGMTDADYARVNRLFQRIRFKYAHIMFPTQALDPRFGTEQRITIEWTLGLAQQHPTIQDIVINEPSHWYFSYPDYATAAVSQQIAQSLTSLSAQFPKINGLVLWQEPNGDGHVPSVLKSPPASQDTIIAAYIEAGHLMRSALVQAGLSSRFTYFGPSAFYVYSSGFGFADQFNSLVSSRIGTTWDAQAWHYYSPYNDVSTGAFQTTLEDHLRRFNPNGRQVLDEFGCRPVANSGASQVAELRSDAYALCVWDALIQALLAGSREIIFWQFAEQYLWSSRSQVGNDDGFQSWAILRNKEYGITPSPWGRLAIAAVDAIKPGATIHRITMSEFSQPIRAVGVRNSDGSMAQLFFNSGSAVATFTAVPGSQARTFSKFSFRTESTAVSDGDGFMAPEQTGVLGPTGVNISIPPGAAAWVVFTP